MNKKRVFVQHMENVFDGREDLSSKELNAIGYGFLGLGILFSVTDGIANKNFTELSIVFSTLFGLSSLPVFYAADDVKKQEVQKTLLKQFQGENYASRKK